MILIVESGATKSTWIIIEGSQIMNFVQLPGINITSNPHSINHVDTFARNNNYPVNKVYFYGAGVSSRTVVENLINKFHSIFGNIHVEVENDILAASRSISSGHPSIVAILGTGTNAVLFDGHSITKGVNSLGHLFNDFGCAFHLGQLTINEYYFDRMSDEDKHLFEVEFLNSRPDFKRTIYTSDKPNYEIAQCAKFLSFASQGLRDRITKQAFTVFFDNQIRFLTDSKEYKLNFVGSVSKVFEAQLRSVAESYGYTIDQIVADPIDGLIKFHIENGND